MRQSEKGRSATQSLERRLMRKIIAGTQFMALAGTLAAAVPGQGRDDHGDKGKHKDWDNPKNPHSSNWDYDHDRIRPGRAYPYGRYGHVKEVFVARRIDYRTRRVVLYDNSNWVVASYDLNRCRDWEWDRDRVYVYNDDHHPGWYLLFNARLGRTVHVEYFGVH